MVMHARKLPRISDGLHEKHQTHSYENARYSSKYRYSNHETKNRDSPSTNSLRSSSPDSRSQSPRCHKAANYYKVREKERERERENRERDRDRERDREQRERHRERNHERERERDRGGEYSDYRDTREDSRSPKDRRREVRDRERDRERERDGRGAPHDRLNSVHKKEEKERQQRVGDWSEHVSSSSKKYYYNCRTEVSQWEKPAEWLEWERQRAKENSHRSHEKTSNRPEKHSSLGESYRDVRVDLRDGDRERTERERRNAYHPDEVYDRRDRKYNQDGGVDMEISSGDSTPTSEHLHNRGNGGVPGPENSHESNSGSGQVSLSTSGLVNSCGPVTSHSNSIAASGHSGLQSKLRGGGHLNNSLPPSSLPNMISGGSSGMNCIAGTSNSTTNHTTANTTITTSSTTSLPPGPLSSLSAPMAVPQILNSHPRLAALTKNNLEMDTSKSSVNSNNSHSHEEGTLGNSKLEPLTISANSNNIGGGPPTPTHSENQDGIDIRKVGSPTSSSINSIQSLSASVGGSLAGLRPSVPALTPSLANYYKEPLITHVQNWPAENLEKQAQRFAEEAHTVGSLVMTRVSAELKMARSLVRLAEIQATLHEQRILFLRAQKRDLEEMKAQNSFMSDT